MSECIIFQRHGHIKTSGVSRLELKSVNFLIEILCIFVFDNSYIWGLMHMQIFHTQTFEMNHALKSNHQQPKSNQFL